MTFVEAERFYNNDSKKYLVEKNKDFLIWLKESIEKDNYIPFIDNDEIQDLINNITMWYEIKYSERHFEYYEGCIDTRFLDLENIINKLDFNQLKYRLNHKQLCLLDCGYRGCGLGISTIYDRNGQIVSTETNIVIKIIKKQPTTDFEKCFLEQFNHQPNFLLKALEFNGKVCVDYELEPYTSKKDINLEELLEEFRNSQTEKLNFEELEQTVSLHNKDLELRNKILQLVALNLVYSRNTIPERGYERAKRFIGEFNKHIPNLNLTTNEIDEIISSDYTREDIVNRKEKGPKQLIKKIRKKFGTKNN